MHARQQIREKIVAVLTGLSTTGTNIFKSRIHALAGSDLPALSIYTSTDESTEFNTLGFPRQVIHTLDLVVEVSVAQKDDVDSELDQICLEVEKKITEDITLGGLVKDCFLDNFDSDFNGDNEQDIGRAQMLWRVGYIVYENDPETLI